jgi:hypothetical protein
MFHPLRGFQTVGLNTRLHERDGRQVHAVRDVTDCPDAWARRTRELVHLDGLRPLVQLDACLKRGVALSALLEMAERFYSRHPWQQVLRTD